MSLVNLPPWAQTALTLTAGALLLAPTVIRYFGWETSDLGARLIHISNDFEKALAKRP